jgi:hypothetical protein
MKMKRLTQKVWNASQSWYYEALWEVVDRKIRVDIRRNAFDHQSGARAQIFDPDQVRWNVIATIPQPQMSCLHLSYAQRNPATPEDFEQDEQRLLDEVKLILVSPEFECAECGEMKTKIGQKVALGELICLDCHAGAIDRVADAQKGV